MFSSKFSLGVFLKEANPILRLVGIALLYVLSDYSVFLLTEYITTLNRRAVCLLLVFPKKLQDLWRQGQGLPYSSSWPQSTEQDQTQRKHYFFNKWVALLCIKHSARLGREGPRTIKTWSLSLIKQLLAYRISDEANKSHNLKSVCHTHSCFPISLPNDKQPEGLSPTPSAQPTDKHVLTLVLLPSSRILHFQSSLPCLAFSPPSLMQPQLSSALFHSPLGSLCYFWEHFLQPPFLSSPLIRRCRISLVTSFKNS